MHIYRDYNTDADSLTWLARTGGCNYQPGEWSEQPYALWGQWDGGCDEQQSAAGWWLAEATTDLSNPWRRKAWEATLMPRGTSVTRAELAGAPRFLHEATAAVGAGNIARVKRLKTRPTSTECSV